MSAFVNPITLLLGSDEDFDDYDDDDSEEIDEVCPWCGEITDDDFVCINPLCPGEEYFDDELSEYELGSDEEFQIY
jgi:hypothetical protein